jgi:hypothetical protein
VTSSKVSLVKQTKMEKYTKTAIKIPNGNKNAKLPKMPNGNKNTETETKIPNGHEIHRGFPYQGLKKIGNFGMKINHLETFL